MKGLFISSSSQEIDTRYAGHVLQIIEDCANDRADGWARLGFLVNRILDKPGVTMYSAVVWNGQKYDKWFPGLAAKALSKFSRIDRII